MHKFKESLTAMIGDFANMNRNPEFKAKSEGQEGEDGEKSTDSSRKPTSGARRHSLNITVGAEELPQIPKRNRSESICSGSSSQSQLPPIPPGQQRGRRSSAPCVSTSGASNQFREKMRKMRSKDDSFTEESKIEEDTLTEAEEEALMAKMAEQRERRPSSYLI